MLSGIAVAAKALRPEIRIVAVEPEGKQLGPNHNPAPAPAPNPNPNPSPKPQPKTEPKPNP